MDGRWMGGGGCRRMAGGWEEVDGRWMGGGRQMDAASAASVWYIMSKSVRAPLYTWRWMGGGYGEWGECICVHCEQTVMTPLYKVKARRANLQKHKPSVTRDSRAISQPSTNLAQPCLSSMFWALMCSRTCGRRAISYIRFMALARTYGL